MRCPATIWISIWRIVEGGTEVGGRVFGEDLGGSCKQNEQHGNLVKRNHVERMMESLEYERRVCEGSIVASSWNLFTEGVSVPAQVQEGRLIYKVDFNGHARIDTLSSNSTNHRDTI